MQPRSSVTDDVTGSFSFEKFVSKVLDKNYEI